MHRLTEIALNATVLTTWGLMVFLYAVCRISTRNLQLEPGRWQTVLEGGVVAMQDAISAVVPAHAARLLPFIGTVWIFVCLANLSGIVPGLHSPTADLSTTAGLALLVFLSVHWYGVRIHGWRRYLKHYLEPSPLLLPFHVIGEISRTIALAVRLFGNMFSLETAALLVLLVAGFLVPVPLLMLHIVEALVQAYIFGMLALVYIAGGIETVDSGGAKEEEGKHA